MVNPIIQELIEKTYHELKTPKKPIQNSRTWKSTNGYIFLIPWSNANLLRILVHKFTDTLPKSFYRYKNQIDDASRSVVANIEEGFARSTTSEYIQFLGYSQGSLKEVKGDIQRALQDNLLPSVPGSKVTDLGIDYKVWHEVLKALVISKPVGETGVRGNYRKLEEPRGEGPLKSFKFLYSPVDNLQADDLIYEIFIELINKTDWHLRRLVESLEKKLHSDRKYYQVKQARIRSRVKGI